MKKGALFILLMSSCALFFAQELQFSRKFQTFKKNVPVAIINNNSCFYVLRYNKSVHDFTIEKRAKPSAEIIGFTPLKMDSVNASWFNYENLDYLFFERDKKLYFVFEKVVNTRRSIYLKVIDSLSHASGFIELANLEQEKTQRNIAFTFKLTANKNILLVATQFFLNGSVKKTAQLYDPARRNVIWSRKLPLENSYTGYSTAFECNAAGDLFYVLDKWRVVSFKRKFIRHQQVNVPVVFHDTITLVSYPHREEPLLRRTNLLANISNLNSVNLLAAGDSVTVLAHLAMQRDTLSDAAVYFFCKTFSGDLQKEYASVTTPLDSSLTRMLTFYDGEDYNSPAAKDYRLLNFFHSNRQCYQLAQRQEDGFYKELLVWQTDLATGKVVEQWLVPCKTAGVSLSRFRNSGGAMLGYMAEGLQVVVPEAPANFKKQAGNFSYHRFKRVSRLSSANVVMYTVKKGELAKRLLYRNSDFDLVPLLYDNNRQPDFLFYLNNVKLERFATWR